MDAVPKIPDQEMDLHDFNKTEINVKHKILEILKEPICICYVFSDELKDSQFNDNQIFNTDQSQFKKELHSGRTLDLLGSKQYKSNALSVCALTHLYTIMPTISKDGKLINML